MRTRLMTLERDAQKRHRVLKQLALLNKAQQGIGMDLIDKLREERNMLQIHKQRALELEAKVEGKESKIAATKRDLQFTRIIELQVEFASWQHETARLTNLLAQLPSNVAQEHEAGKRRVRQLEEKLRATEAQRAKLVAEAVDIEAETLRLQEQVRERNGLLTRDRGTTQVLADDLDHMIQRRKEAETLQSNMEELRTKTCLYQEAVTGAPADESVPLPRQGVSTSALRGEASASFVELLLLSQVASTNEGSLFAHFLLVDQDRDGLLSSRDLSQAFGAHVAVSSREATEFIRKCPTGTQSTEDGEWRIRWLDLLVLLDRFGSKRVSPVSSGALPAVSLLRCACLRAQIGRRQFQQSLLDANTPAQARSWLRGVGVDENGLEQWTAALCAHGPAGLLIRLPMADVALAKDSLVSWRSRCIQALKLHQDDLTESFRTWGEDSQVSHNQFREVCVSVFGKELSVHDVEDLLLVCGDQQSLVRGDALLAFSD